MTTFKVVASGDKYSFRAEVGPIDPERWGDETEGFTEGFAFGMTAEVFASSRFGSEDPSEAEYEVTMGAIGSHDTQTARKRILSYRTATTIAEHCNSLRGLSGDTSFERMAATFDGLTFEKDLFGRM